MVKKIDESDNKSKKFIKNKLKNTLVSKIKNKFKFKLQKDKSQKELIITKKEKARKIILESVKDHFFTFRLTTDLFTLLYTTLVFKWIQTEKVVIIVDDNKIGYHLELFLRHFRMSAIFLDSEMPVNTNKHFCAQFLKGSYTICITSSKFEENSPNFAEEILENTPIPATIIYFDTISKSNLEFHCYHSNTKAIYHFIAANKKVVNNFKFYRHFSQSNMKIFPRTLLFRNINLTKISCLILDTDVKIYIILYIKMISKRPS